MKTTQHSFQFDTQEVSESEDEVEEQGRGVAVSPQEGVRLKVQFGGWPQSQF